MVPKSVIDAETLDTSALARSGSRGTLIAIQLALLVVLSCCGLLYVEFGFDALPLIDAASWAVVVVVVYAFWSWRRMGGSFFDPYSLFLISATLFNGGLAFLQVLGLNEEGVLAGVFVFTADTTLTALFLTASGLAAMNLGALIAARKGKPLLPESAISPPMETQALRRAGWLLLAVSIVPSVLLAGSTLTAVSTGGYFALYQRAAETSFAAGPQILAAFFVPAVLCLLAGSNHSRAYLVVCSMLMLNYSATLLVAGTRYGAIAPLLAFAWVWDRCVKPISSGVMVATALVLMIVIFPMVRGTRDVALSERGILESGIASLVTQQNPATFTLEELGGSLSTVAYTIDLVPGVRQFDYGLGYLQSALTIIPNVFGELHPALARGTPTRWLVETVAPSVAAAGGGFGYSFIAEAYLNFGFWGTPVVLFLIGFLYARFVIWGAWSNDPVKIVAVGSFLAFFLVFPRGDSTNVIRPLIWYSLLVYILVLSLRKRRLST